ncbi:MAG: CoA-binding protein [Cyanophyceae cyanobacterium]
MPNLNQDDQVLREVLMQTQTIAVVGHSDKPSRTSYQIAQFLRDVGYLVYPVNPMVKEIDGQPSYSCLRELPEVPNLVNVFRRSDCLAEIVEEAIAVGVQTVWAQLGVSDDRAAQKALSRINLITDTCIKREYQRLVR